MSKKYNYKYAMDAAARSTMKRLDPAEIINASMEKRNRKVRYSKNYVVVIIAACVLILGSITAYTVVTGMRDRSTHKTVENDAPFSEDDSEKTVVLPEEKNEAHIINDVFAKSMMSLPDKGSSEDFSFEFGIQFGDTLEEVNNKVRKVEPYMEKYWCKPVDDPALRNLDLDFYRANIFNVKVDGKRTGLLSAFFEKNDDVQGKLIGLEYCIYCESKDSMTPNNFNNVDYPLTETYDYYYELLTQKYGNPIPETTSYDERIPLKGYFAVRETIAFKWHPLNFPEPEETMDIDNYAEWLIPTDDGMAVKIELGTVEKHQLLEKGDPPYLWSEMYHCYIDYTIISAEDYQEYLSNK